MSGSVALLRTLRSVNLLDNQWPGAFEV